MLKDREAFLPVQIFQPKMLHAFHGFPMPGAWPTPFTLTLTAFGDKHQLRFCSSSFHLSPRSCAPFLSHHQLVSSHRMTCLQPRVLSGRAVACLLSQTVQSYDSFYAGRLLAG
jgi:hypothetical protein